MIEVLALLLLVAFWLVARREEDTYLSEYLFFIRVPLILGSVLVLLPWYGPTLAPESLTNLFALSFWELMFATFVAFLAAWSIAYTARLIWLSVPGRCGLFYTRKQQDVVKKNDQEFQQELSKLKPTRLTGVQYLMLGLGMTVWLPIRADGSGEKWYWAWLGYAIGGGGALAILALSRLLERHDLHDLGRMRSRVWLPPFVRALPDRVVEFHRGAAWFVIMSFAVYCLLFVLGHPGWDLPTQDMIPPVTYVYLLIMLAAWIGAALTLKFDRCRAPVFILTFLILIGWQTFMPSTHYYDVVQREGISKATVDEAMQSWWRGHGQPDKVAAVACSGGGITASYWTAFALGRLEAEIPDFGRRVGLVSSVSGGGIGAMLYVDAFSEEATPAARMDEIARKAGTSSLSAVVWGMAYCEVSRLLLAKWQPADRGWAMEQVWHGFVDDGSRQLSDWQAGVLAGWRPLMVFNATHQESGQRLLLSPFPAGEDVGEMRTSLAPGWDMDVVTAARLSATFPFVSPQAKPSNPAAITGGSFHVSDGGYFDNSGIVSILEILRGLTDTQKDKEAGINSIVLIELRAGPRFTQDVGGPEKAVLELELPEPAAGGIMNDLVGPLDTLAKVRNTSQVSRNETMVRLVSDLAEKKGIELRSFTFVLSPDEPLSWHLTETERREIRAHWPGQEDDYVRELEEEQENKRKPSARLQWIKHSRTWNEQTLEQLEAVLK